MRSWLRRIGEHLGTRREQRALQRRAIPDDLWKRTLIRFSFLQRRDPADQAELRRLTSLFLDQKEFTSVGGLRLTDAMVVAVAAQAVLPVLRLGLARYHGFIGIVLHPGAVRARRESMDADGIVHAYDEELTGEAMDGGPVMLSWHDVRAAGHSAAAGYNVVIHEFAHVLDLASGIADGMPALPVDIDREEWRDVWSREFDAFVAIIDAPGVAGSETPTILDPYGATAPAEFFAVASEAFFVKPDTMQTAHESLYRLLQRFYRQDPAADQPQRRGP